MFANTGSAVTTGLSCDGLTTDSFPVFPFMIDDPTFGDWPVNSQLCKMNSGDVLSVTCTNSLFFTFSDYLDFPSYGDYADGPDDFKTINYTCEDGVLTADSALENGETENVNTVVCMTDLFP